VNLSGEITRLTSTDLATAAHEATLELAAKQSAEKLKKELKISGEEPLTDNEV
jgi:hypothetical protein